MLAGGTGLAPFLSMLRQVPTTGSAQPIHLVYGVTNDARPGRARDARGTSADASPNFTLRYLRRRPGQQASAQGLCHRSIWSAEHLNDGDVDVYLCGPPPMVEAVRGLVRGPGRQAGELPLRNSASGTAAHRHRRGLLNRSASKWTAGSARAASRQGDGRHRCRPGHRPHRRARGPPPRAPRRAGGPRRARPRAAANRRRGRRCGGTAVGITADLENYAGADSAMAQALELRGRIDILINNVGGTIWAKPYASTTTPRDRGRDPRARCSRRCGAAGPCFRP